MVVKAGDMLNNIVKYEDKTYQQFYLILIMADKVERTFLKG